MAIGQDRIPAGANLDGITAYGDLEREYIKVAIKAIPCIHHMLSVSEMLYTRGNKEMWFYDDEEKIRIAVYYKRGFRQGCVLCPFLFCPAMGPVYKKFTATLGHENALYFYSGDAYLLSTPYYMATTLSRGSAGPILQSRFAARMWA